MCKYDYGPGKYFYCKKCVQYMNLHVFEWVLPVCLNGLNSFYISNCERKDVTASPKKIKL